MHTHIIDQWLGCTCAMYITRSQRLNVPVPSLCASSNEPVKRIRSVFRWEEWDLFLRTFPSKYVKIIIIKNSFITVIYLVLHNNRVSSHSYSSTSAANCATGVQYHAKRTSCWFVWKPTASKHWLCVHVSCCHWVSAYAQSDLVCKINSVYSLSERPHTKAEWKADRVEIRVIIKYWKKIHF